MGGFFAAIFNKIPTYDEIKFETHKNSPLPEVNELFQIRSATSPPLSINV